MYFSLSTTKNNFQRDEFSWLFSKRGVWLVAVKWERSMACGSEVREHFNGLQFGCPTELRYLSTFTGII